MTLNSLGMKFSLPLFDQAIQPAGYKTLNAIESLIFRSKLAKRIETLNIETAIT